MQKIATKDFSRVAVYLFLASCLVILNYFTPRANFAQLLTFYLAAFAAYFYILFYWKDENVDEAKYVAILFRVLLLFSVPNLSDDVYRFVWDGHMMLGGANPYLSTPTVFYQTLNMHEFDFSDAVYNNLNSKEYYSVYPPICQMIFFISAALSFENLSVNIFLLKVFILLSEFGTIYFLQKIIRLKGVPAKNILFYSMNPLILIELTGNVHFEAAMIFFLTLSVYLLLQNKFYLSAIFLGLAAASKIWPLFLLPFFISYFGWRKTILYAGTVCIVFFLSFVPFFSPQTFLNISESLQLYFVSFEFNASLYYLLKFITGQQMHAKEIIQTLLPAIYLLVLVMLAWKFNKEDKLQFFLFAFFLYMMFATTVHPWYLAPLLLFSCITRFRFPVLWSCLICFTYITYKGAGFEQNFYVITLEYVLLLSFVLFELFGGERKKFLAKTGL